MPAAAAWARDSVKVWRYCVVLALFETVALAGMVLYAMMRNGDGYTILSYGDLGVLSNLMALPAIAALMVRSHRKADAT